MKPFWRAFAAAALIAVVAASALVFLKVVLRYREDSVGWHLKPILVAARDVPAGKPLSAADLAEKGVPEMFVLEADVPSDAAKLILGQPIDVPVLQGDAIVWTMFGGAKRTRLIDRCVQAVAGPAREEANRSSQEFARKLVELRKRPEPPADIVPTTQGDQIDVVVASRALPASSRLTRDSLRVKALPARLFTSSFVPASAIDRMPGALLLFPLEPGDPILWQSVDDATSPQSLTACLVLSGADQKQVRTVKSVELAKQFLAKEPQ